LTPLAAHGDALIETKKRTHQRASRRVQEGQFEDAAD
jgi:hypothetical protein